MLSEDASSVEYPIDFKTRSYDQSFGAKIIKVCFQPDFKQLVLCIFSCWLLTFVFYPNSLLSNSNWNKIKIMHRLIHYLNFLILIWISDNICLCHFRLYQNPFTFFQNVTHIISRNICVDANFNRICIITA